MVGICWATQMTTDKVLPQTRAFHMQGATLANRQAQQGAEQL